MFKLSSFSKKKQQTSNLKSLKLHQKYQNTQVTDIGPKDSNFPQNAWGLLDGTAWNHIFGVIPGNSDAKRKKAGCGVGRPAKCCAMYRPVEFFSAVQTPCFFTFRVRVPRFNTENVILCCAVQKSPRILGEI